MGYPQLPTKKVKLGISINIAYKIFGKGGPVVDIVSIGVDGI
jgi:hypothetical protein